MYIRAAAAITRL